MPAPTSSGVAGAAAFKVASGAAAGGARLVTIAVMLMTPPRSICERVVGLISTVVTGMGGGAMAVQYFRLQEWVDSMIGLVALGGLIFGYQITTAGTALPGPFGYGQTLGVCRPGD